MWLASGDGRRAHEIRGLPAAGLAGWSPARDVLAATTGATVRLVWPSGRVRTLVRAAGVTSAAWSPDGSAIAVAVSTPRASTLASYPLNGTHPAAWLTLHPRSSAPGGQNYLIDPVGSWPRQGIGFWAVTNYPGERLAACRNPVLAAEQAGKREDLHARPPRAAMLCTDHAAGATGLSRPTVG